MRRRGAGVALLVLLVLAAPAPAAVRVRTDRANFMRFRLAGRTLTVRSLLDTRALWGERVRAVCRSRSRTLEATRRWPRRAHAVAFRFARDVSRTARACRLESAPTRVTIAWVRF